MEVIIQPDARQASRVGARIVAQLLRKKPNAVLGFATGSTPLMLYRELIELHRSEGLDFSGVTTFNLDEYVGINPAHEASYHQFMHRNLFDHLNVPKERIHIPDGMAEDIPTACAAYEAAIQAAGGIDLQILGIGSDGHVGFNEPTSSLSSRTRIKTLDTQTRKDNARFFASIDEVPRHCITMGVGTIMEARTCLLLAFGESKAEAVAQAVEGSISAMCTASVLQWHRDARFLLDEPAAGLLKKAAYFREVYAGKPAWQRY